MRRVAVVDYGMGNLRSVSQAVAHVAREAGGFEVVVTARPDEVFAAERIVLPGQGAMPDCMRELRDSGLQEAVLDAAATKPLMGVCVGMQMLLDRSAETADAGAEAGSSADAKADAKAKAAAEHGAALDGAQRAGPLPPAWTPGLGLIPGEVVRFRLAGRLQPDGSRYKVPQMGWNEVLQARPHPIWNGIPDASHFYFVHSFYAAPSDPRHSVGVTDYGGLFTSVVARDNIFATQFHPEKSAELGLALYRNFLHWKP